MNKHDNMTINEQVVKTIVKYDYCSKIYHLLERSNLV